MLRVARYWPGYSRCVVNEFDLIHSYFKELAPTAPGVLAGIGDDCALLQAAGGEALAVTTDTLISGRHFPERTAAFDIGWKALAVNLSDLAAAGAEPRWFTLALTLPAADAEWLKAFAEGLGTLARQQRIALVGGDTTRGSLSITITAMGVVPAAQALNRRGARAGDVVCVTGTLGDAVAGLRILKSTHSDTGNDARYLIDRLNRPQPRVAAGIALRGIAHAAIDLSDGLAGDLRHVLDASGVGADIWLERLPTSPALMRAAVGMERWSLQAAGGDDYELCVCLPPEAVAPVRAALDVPLTEIGRIDGRGGLRLLDASGGCVEGLTAGYLHFQ
jgi:thiamine-monophosphate kinase